MTTRERFLTEVWEAESIRSGVRMLELCEKAQDSGLDEAELDEYERMLAENQRLFREYLMAIRTT